ncbi:MAG: aminotransferase class I/II-fold pyridoxal phosphate-dependent enzyme [Thermoplasmataceae archaeon]
MEECVKHGGDIQSFSRSTGISFENIIDLSSNANDFYYPKIDFESASASIRYYPEVDLSEFKEKLSKLCLVGKDNVFLTAGLTDFIYQHMNRQAGRTAIVLTPSYGEFGKSGITSGVHTVSIPARLVYNNPKILRNYRFSSLVISRPEPPTGNFPDFDRIESLLNIADEAGASTFIDEAFIDFVLNYDRGEAKRMIGDHGSVYLGRSLTKVLPFPGLRIGYILASQESVENLESEGRPWRIGQFDLNVLRQVDLSFIDDLPGKVNSEKQYLIKNMDELGYLVVGDPAANFVTFKTPSGVECKNLGHFLAKHGIMIRCLGSFGSFDGSYIRVAVKRRELLDRLVEAVRLFGHDG